MPDILHLLTIHARPERVFESLTQVDEIRQWWMREAEIDPHVGGHGEIRFNQGRGVTRFVVDTLAASSCVAWTITSSNAPGGWEGTTVRFDLAADNDRTILRFAHRGFKQESDGLAIVTTGWAYYLTSLQKHIEQGQGTPR